MAVTTQKYTTLGFEIENISNFSEMLSMPWLKQVPFPLTFICSKSTIETLEKGVKYVQI